MLPVLFLSCCCRVERFFILFYPSFVTWLPFTIHPATYFLQQWRMQSEHFSHTPRLCFFVPGGMLETWTLIHEQDPVSMWKLRRGCNNQSYRSKNITLPGFFSESRYEVHILESCLVLLAHYECSLPVQEVCQLLTFFTKSCVLCCMKRA